MSVLGGGLAHVTISELARQTGEAPPADSSGDLLELFRASRHQQAAEELRQLRLALDYCAFNSADSLHPEAATMPGTDREVGLAGEGAPSVTEFAVIELGAVAGMSTDAARTYLGRVLELGHRLPETWRATCAGAVPVWRALRIADHTLRLPADAAAWVDLQVAPVAGRIGPVLLDRLVEEAVLRFDPETAALLALEALETRHATVTVEHIIDAALCTGRLDAVLDVADALDLDAALAELAADLAEAGDASPLDVRRAKALGLLARGEAPGPVAGAAAGRDGAAEARAGDAARRRPRQVVLHVHLTELALHGCGDGVATLTTTHTGHPLGQVCVEQVQEWCAGDGAVITVRPILDLAESLESAGYRPSARLQEQVISLHPRCAFPHCTRPSGSADLDHIVEFASGGPTRTENLAPLCRRHHRAKTHGGWRYVRLGPAEYLWTSPHGHQWVTDPDGTIGVERRRADTG